MAPLNFDVYAYDLESAVRIIRRGLDAAERALGDEEAQVLAEMEENNRKTEAGEATGGSVSGGGDDSYDPNEFYGYDFMTIESTQMEVRKSMMVALYHAWERVVRSLTKKKSPKDNHAELEAALAEHGITLTPELNQLRMLVNFIKHNSIDKMAQLWKVRPDLFYDGFHPDKHFPDDWSDAVRLGPTQIDGFFAAVLASGPSHQPRTG